MKPLKIFAIGAEVAIVSTLAVSSYNAAFGGAGGISWMAGAPILTVVALETLRVPTALNFLKTGWMGRVMSGALIIGLSVVTMEAATLSFTNLISERTRPVVEAELELKKITIDQSPAGQEAKDRTAMIQQLTDELAAARKHREDIDKPVQLQPVAPDKTCYRVVGKGKHVQRIAYNCNSQAQNDAAKGNRNEQDTHAAELKTATGEVTALEKRLAELEAIKPDTSAADKIRTEAERKVADARAMNPMYQLAAAWQRTPVQELTPEEFEQVKHWAVIALAAATAFVTSIAAVISEMPAKGSGKISRAFRAMLAARRKTLRRIDERVRVEYGTKFVYVPCDPVTGKAYDKSPNLRVAS